MLNGFVRYPDEPIKLNQSMPLPKKMYEFNWSYAVTSLHGSTKGEILTDLDSMAVNLAVAERQNELYPFV